MSEAVTLIEDPLSIPLEDINVSDAHSLMYDNHWGYSERLRKEDPIHFCKNSLFGPHWSATKLNDTMGIGRDHVPCLPREASRLPAERRISRPSGNRDEEIIENPIEFCQRLR